MARLELPPSSFIGFMVTLGLMMTCADALRTPQRFEPRSRNLHQYIARNISQSSSSLQKRATSVFTVQPFAGSGDGTYYYETSGTGGCGDAQPAQVKEYAERYGYPTCLGSVPPALHKQLKDYNTNMIVAAANFDFKYCGKEVKVKDKSGNWKGGYIYWDKCAGCKGGLDFSSTAMFNLFGMEACNRGRIQIDFEITNNQLMDPLVDIGGTALPAVVDGASAAAFGAEGCKIAEMNKRICSADNTFTKACIMYNTGTEKNKIGLNYWSKESVCAGDTKCNPNGDGLGTGMCVF